MPQAAGKHTQPPGGQRYAYADRDGDESCSPALNRRASVPSNRPGCGDLETLANVALVLADAASIRDLTSQLVDMSDF
jgi:hypothetical protein